MFVSVLLQPLDDVTVKLISYSPALSKQCCGFCWFEGKPSSNAQLQLFIVPLSTVVKSENCTHKGAHPLVTLELKTIVGEGFTITVTTVVPEQPKSVPVTV